MVIVGLYAFLILVLPGSCLLCQEGSVSNSDILLGREMTGPRLVPDKTVFIIPAVSSWMYCAQLCLRRVACKSLVFDNTSDVCQGYVVKATDTDYELNSAPSKSYTDADSIHQNIAGPCSGHSCDHDEICVPEGFTGFHCVTVGRCSNTPQLPEDAIIVESSTRILSYKCDEDEITTKITTWCFWDEKWTPVVYLECD